MNVKFLFATLVILLAMMTFFALDTVADTEYTPNVYVVYTVFSIIGILLLVIIFLTLARKRRDRPFLKEHRSLLASDDPKVLLDLVEKCNEYREGRNIPEISSLARQAKDKARNIQQVEEEREWIQRKQTEERERIQREQANLAAFRSEISEDGSYPRVVAALKEQMHNPDSFQHVSSDYETVEQDGKPYHKIVMTFRATNTFNALVLQTCYFIVDTDNQVSLVGSPDGTESSPVNTVSLAAAADAAASAVEGAATLADLLLLFSSDE